MARRLRNSPQASLFLDFASLGRSANDHGQKLLAQKIAMAQIEWKPVITRCHTGISSQAW